MIKRARDARIAALGSQAIEAAKLQQVRQEALDEGIPLVNSPTSVPRPTVLPIPDVVPEEEDGGLFPTISLPVLDRLPGSGFDILNEALDLVPGPRVNIAAEVYNRYISSIAQPAAASQLIAVEPLFGLPSIPGLARSESTQPLVRNEFAQLIKGEQGLGEFGADLGAIQRQRPTSEQIVSEALGPLGMAENLVPVGALGRLGKGTNQAQAAIRAATSAAVTRVVSIPQVDDIIRRVNDPATAERLNNIPGVRSLVDKLNPSALADRSNPVHRFIMAKAVGEEVVSDSANVMTQRVLAHGDPRQVFRLGDDFASTAPGLEGKFLNEIAQFPERFRLTPEQTAWLNNFTVRLDDMNRYLVAEGVQADDLFTKGPKGRYFPNVWKMFNDIELVRTGQAQTLGRKPFYENSRFYEDAADAIETGFRPGDPLEATEMLFKSMYRQVLDARLADIIKPFSNTIRQRVSPEVIRYRDFAVNRVQGVKSAQTLVRNFTAGTKRPPGPGTLRSLRNSAGFQRAVREAPDLMDELESITRLRSPKRYRAARAQLRQKLADQLAEATTNARNAKIAAFRARKAAEARGNFGEAQFPLTGLRGQIFTPDDVANHIFPDAHACDLATMPREQIAQLVEAMKPQTKGFLDATLAVSSAFRTAKAGTDIGVMMLHGLPTLLTKPGVWAKATETSLRGAVDPVTMAKFVDDHFDTIAKLVERNQLGGAGSEYVEALRSGGLIHQGLRRLEGSVLSPAAKAANKGLSTVEAQFNGFLIASKVLLYEAMEPMALRSGNPAALDELASHVAKMTGSISMANLGIRPTTRKVLGSFLLFAPRYRMATVALMTDIARGGLKGEFARDALTKMMASGLLMYAAVTHRLGQKMELDPRKGAFGTIDFLGDRIGPGGAHISLGRMAAKMALSISQGDIGDVPGIVKNAARSMTSPISGSAWDVWSGRDYLGNLTRDSLPTFGKTVIQMFLPFYVEGLADSPRPGFGGVTGEILGLRAYATDLRTRANQLADVYAHQQGDVDFKDLNKLEQNRILRAHPNLQADFDEANEVWNKRSSGLSARIGEYYEHQTRIQDEYAQGVEDALAIRARTLGGKRFRVELQALGRTQRESYERLERPKSENGLGFDDVVAAFNEEAQNPDAHIEDVAYGEYIRTVVAGDFETEDGEFDFQARDNAEAAFIAKWAPEVWQYVRDRRRESREIPPNLQELYDGRATLKGYWEVGELLLENSGQAALIPQYRKYVKARQFEREEMAEETPTLKSIHRQASLARQEYRRTHQDADAWLFRWEYTDSLRHPGNKALDPVEILRTPVFLGQ